MICSMDKETISHYGWIIVCLMLGLCMVLMSTPLGNYIFNNVKFTTINQIKTITHQDSFDNSANKPAKKYSITYNLNGGAWEGTYIEEYTPGKEITLPTNVKRDKYVFNGWTKTNGSSTKYENIRPTDTGNLTYYASWVGEQYSITYNLNGGSFNNANNVKFHYRYGDAFSLSSIPYTPTKAGSAFQGWYSDPALTKRVTSISATTSGNMTLYAKWS